MANGEKGKGRSNNQRLKLFYLLDYLLKNTDETHTVKVQEIIEHFENYYKIPVEQKTVCSDLHLLDEYGYETQYDGRTRGCLFYLSLVLSCKKMLILIRHSKDCNADSVCSYHRH